MADEEVPAQLPEPDPGPDHGYRPHPGGVVLGELSPASPWCQRWRYGAHSWRHRSEGGFDRDRYSVEAIAEADARSFVLDHHYSHSLPPTRLRFGLLDHGPVLAGTGPAALVGAAVLTVPVQAAVLTNVFPGLEPYEESLELGRLVLLDSEAANAETFFLARAFALAAAAGVRGVVSFADPVPRLVAGRVFHRGHVGAVYQAKGATYTGRGTARSLVVLPDGSVLNDRSMQKVRSGERGHAQVERRLVALGARAPRAGQRGAQWLAQALESVGATRLRHRGNHRYAWALGTTRTQRQGVRLALGPQPYPKRLDLVA